MNRVAGIFALSLAMTGLAGLARAEEAPNPIPTVVENQWRGSITPYLWLENVSGMVARDGNTLGTVNVDTSSLLSNLNFAAMVEGEVHRGFAPHSRTGDAANDDVIDDRDLRYCRDLYAAFISQCLC